MEVFALSPAPMHRIHPLNDMVEPTPTWSSIDKEDPKRPSPYIDMQLPYLTIDLNDKADDIIA
jgi:hypothetical protein